MRPALFLVIASPYSESPLQENILLKGIREKRLPQEKNAGMEKTDLALLHSEGPHNQVMSLLSSL